MKNGKKLLLCGTTIILLMILLSPTPTKAATISSISAISDEDLPTVLEEKSECEAMYGEALDYSVKVSRKALTITNYSPVEWIIYAINDSPRYISIPVGGTYYVSSTDFTGTDKKTGLASATIDYTTGSQYYLVNGTCYLHNATGEASFSGGAATIKGSSNCDNAVTTTGYNQKVSLSLDCNHTKNEFEVAFCASKNSAIAAGHTYNMSNSSYSNAAATFSSAQFKSDYVINNGLSCVYDINNTAKVPSVPEALTGDAYFVNNQNFYAEHKQTISTTYYYYYAPGRYGYPSATIGATVSCKRICGEAVSIDYGPPVAKKAGMSFEYRVKITTRVDCHADTSSFPAPPTCDCTWCSPAPSCLHHSSSGDWSGPQAGPNAQYESCVNSCDNGKYTKKCTDKCYKKVYANKSSNDSNNELLASKTSGAYGSLEYCKSLPENRTSDTHGCYYREWFGIDWSDMSPNNAGRWYFENNKTYDMGCSSEGQFCPDEHGFRRKIFSGGRPCGAECEWTESCRQNQYLNPGMGKKDCEKNVDRWNTLIDQCNQAATCSTQTSYYTIGAGYNDTEIIFPRGATNNVTDGDWVRYQHTNSAGSDPNRTKTTLMPNYPSNGQGIQGCYNYSRYGDPIPNRLYLTTWGFPTTWMNAKTGEISYDSQEGQTGWGRYIKRFVIPFDQKAVNSDWWNAFYRKNMNYSSMSISEASVTSQCLEGGGNTIINPKINPSVQKWNINAHARKVGWFKWNFDIKCFYATNPKPLSPTTTSSSTTKKECDPNKDNVRVRSVDLENLFPATDGSSLPSTSSTGRQPGFNWSKYAIQNKNVGYSSDPTRLISYIQSTGYKIYDNATYSDKYLDYKFVLTPSSIRSMRGKNDGSNATGNYTGFAESGFFLDENGVLRYYSAKIRHLSDSVVPEKKWLKCNNLGDYRTGCYTP